MAIFLFYDLLGWCVKAGILDVDAQRLSHKSSQFWLVSLFFLLLRDLYELRIIGMQHGCDRYDHVKDERRSSSSGSNVFQMLARNPNLLLDIVKNVGDCVVVLSSLKKISVSQGTVGLAGVVSSVIGLGQILQPQYKLFP